MFSACGPGRARVAHRARSSRSTSSRSRSRKRQRLEPVGRPRRRAAPRSEAFVIGRPPSPAIDRVAVQLDARRAPCARSRETIPPTPTASAFSSTTTRCAPAERRAHRVERERPERRDAERRRSLTPSSRSSSTASSIVPSTEPSATTIVSASVGAVAADQPAGVAAERAPRTPPAICGISVERLHLLGVRQVAHLGERLGPDHRADRHRLGRVEHLARLERRQEGVDLLLRRARRPRSKACVRMKPSMHTITGSESSSASRNAWMCRSTASWLASA